MFGHYGGYHSPPCVFSMPQQAPESQHSQGYKIQISYACISCAPEKAPEFGTFSTLATALGQTSQFLGENHKTRTYNLHHWKAWSVAVIFSLRVRVQHIQKGVQ